LKEKANYLRDFDLSWWIDAIDPVLDKFIDAMNGEIDTDFWRNI